MDREKEIIEAGIEYTMQNNPVCIGGDNFYEQAKEFNRNRSFEAGAQWADEHFKNPWVSVNDRLPEENTTVLILTEFGDYTIGYLYMDNEWYSDLDGYNTYVDYWMPIPELK